MEQSACLQMLTQHWAAVIRHIQQIFSQRTIETLKNHPQRDSLRRLLLSGLQPNEEREILLQPRCRPVLALYSQAK
jgi:hypothetical protein